MNRSSLWKMSVATTAEAADAVTEALAQLCGTAASSHTDVRTGRVTVSVFLEKRPADLPELRQNWRAFVQRLKFCGLRAGQAPLRIEVLRRENWAESWKRHFKPLEIGEALLLKPSWHPRKARRGQALVVVDPGLSFGTGQHPTTAYCLRELVRLARREPFQSAPRRMGTKPWRRRQGNLSPRWETERQPRAFLDIGTGSGILAIAAAKLGYAPAHAFDFDAESVRVARANARANRVAHKLRVSRADLTKLPASAHGRYDVVCANLISTLLIAERKRIRQLLRPGACLVVAGILTTEFAGLRRAFERVGLCLIRRHHEKEWTSATFTSPRIGRT